MINTDWYRELALGDYDLKDLEEIKKAIDKEIEERAKEKKKELIFEIKTQIETLLNEYSNFGSIIVWCNPLNDQVRVEIREVLNELLLEDSWDKE